MCAHNHICEQQEIRCRHAMTQLTSDVLLLGGTFYRTDRLAHSSYLRCHIDGKTTYDSPVVSKTLLG